MPQNVVRRQQILPLAASPQPNYGRMIAQQKCILDGISLPCRHHALLQRVSFRVAKQSQINDQALIEHRPDSFVVAQHAAPLQATSQTLIRNPFTLANPSPIASHTVGCACIMFIMSSMVPSRFSTVAASAPGSVASGPIMRTPTTWPHASSATTCSNTSWL